MSCELAFTKELPPCKEIQESFGLSIPHRGFRILGTGFQSLSLELGFCILIVSRFRIPYAVFPIPEPRIHGSKRKIFPGSGFQKQKFHGFWGAKIRALLGKKPPFTAKSMVVRARVRPL